MTEEQFDKVTKKIERFQEVIGTLRLVLTYLIFDLEATRRERDELRMRLEDQNDD